MRSVRPFPGNPPSKNSFLREAMTQNSKNNIPKFDNCSDCKKYSDFRIDTLYTLVFSDQLVDALIKSMTDITIIHKRATDGT